MPPEKLKSGMLLNLFSVVLNQKYLKWKNFKTHPDFKDSTF